MEMEKNVVMTTYGKVAGRPKNDLLYFEGIPYGADTSGENRFLPPKPPVPWAGIKDCTHFVAKGYQWVNDTDGGSGNLDENSPMFQLVKQMTGLDEELLGQKEEISENCLHLNVLTPNTDDKKRPVLFYIHGGGFDTGSGTQAMAAAQLVKEEDTVVVSVNERLSAFGYLYLGHLSEKYKDSGNVGILDIIAALKWVQENIAAFGGDPGNVTLIGESGGGMKICALLAMQEAAGLFHKAISISGVMAAGAYSKADAAKTTDHILHALHIEPEDFEKLLSVPAQEILRVCQDRSLFVEDRLFFLPVGDGIHISENPNCEFLTYPWSRDIPFIAGSSECECGLGFFDFQMTRSEALRLLCEGGSELLRRHLPMDKETAELLYNTVEMESSPGTAPWKIYIKAVSQWSTLGQGAHEMIRERSKSGGAPCWLYNMAFESEMGAGPAYRCAWHTAELMAFFRKTTTPRDERLSKAIGKLLGLFMRTGSPYEDDYQWLPYDVNEDKLLNFDEQIAFVKDPLRRTRALCKTLNPKQLL